MVQDRIRAQDRAWLGDRLRLMEEGKEDRGLEDRLWVQGRLWLQDRSR